MLLRIVSWNCNMALRHKFEALLALRPDVAIIQECARPDERWRPACRDADWIGFNDQKGLGVFTFGDLILRRHVSYSDRFSLYLPVEIDGACRFNLLGVWVADARKIPPGATNDPAAAIDYYRPFLEAAPSVVAGDFNRLPQQMSARSRKHAASVVERLTDAGLANAAHVMSDATGQDALRRTHYHQRHFARGFVVDYLFIPDVERARLTAFEVGDPHDWLRWSDHVALVAELDLTGESRFLQPNHRDT
ncbi:MAG: endonuclease/exonuclease/phosphatase family protein [Anaerolineae bacterium]|nr:endonuclease/exonuclease/phosphatase family protein [Anaerolineae bacterium]